MREPVIRETNPFPDLLLVVLTLCNVIPTAPATIVALWLLAFGWWAPTALVVALAVAAIPILHVAGPVMAWSNRSWPFEGRLICVLLPLFYLALVTSIMTTLR
ncbi:MAG: hypothetical protein NT015_05190 [Alphaproteobacteria bacterium]|nr:hypothetical protein [Alphaproteobacteria bacterium]